MSTLRLQHEDGRAVSVYSAEHLLCRYVYVPGTAHNESARPYFHPVNSLAGDTLTNFRPNAHPWHHGLSFTLTNVSGWNFWGGPTCRREDGYKWREDHGEQQHVAWTRCEAAGAAATLAHTLEWRTPTELFFREERTVTLAVNSATEWTLRWRARVVNVSGRELLLGNPCSFGGLAGSHYTGLQFRGARALLDDHGDATIRLMAEGGEEGEKAVHGAAGRWMEWHGQLDGSLHRVTLRFENPASPLRWFVRRGYPLAAFPVQVDQNLALAPGAALDVDHLLTITAR